MSARVPALLVACLACAGAASAQEQERYATDLDMAARHMALGPAAAVEVGWAAKLGGVSQDGTRALTLKDFQLELWAVGSRSIVRMLRVQRPFGQEIEGCGLDPTGRRVVTLLGGRRRRVLVWRVQADPLRGWRLRPALELRDAAGASAVGYRPDGSLWVADERGVRLFRPLGEGLGASGHVALARERSTPRRVVWAGDAALLDLEGGPTTWCPAPGAALRAFPETMNIASCADLAPDGQHAVTGSHSGDGVTLFRLDEAGPSPVWADGLGGQTVTAVAFDPRGRWLLAGLADGAMRCWTLGKGDPAPLPSFPGQCGQVWRLLFAASGERLFSVQGTRLLVYELSTRDPGRPGALPPATPILAPETVWEEQLDAQALACSPDGRRLAGLVGDDLVVWTLEQDHRGLRELARIRHRFPGTPGLVHTRRAQRFLDDERLVVWGQGEDLARLALFRLAEGRLELAGAREERLPQAAPDELPPPLAPFLHVSPDRAGRWLLSNGLRDGLRCHDLSTPDLREVDLRGAPELARQPFQLDRARGLADRRWLLSGSAGLQLLEGRPLPEGGLELVRLARLEERHALAGRSPSAVLPDGRLSYLHPLRPWLELRELQVAGERLSLGPPRLLGYSLQWPARLVAHPAGRWGLIEDQRGGTQLWDLGGRPPRLLAQPAAWASGREFQFMGPGDSERGLRPGLLAWSHRPPTGSPSLRLDQLPDQPRQLRIGADPVVWSWSAEPPGELRPALSASLQLGRAAAVGDEVQLTVKLTNQGAAPLHLVRGELTASDPAALAPRPLFFGTVRPGTTALRRLTLRANQRMHEGGVRYTLRLVEQHGRPLPAAVLER